MQSKFYHLLINTFIYNFYRLIWLLEKNPLLFKIFLNKFGGLRIYSYICIEQ